MPKGPMIPAARIERAILVLRGHKILLDTDLAALYEVQTRVLVQAVKRNLERFPEDFMFQLTNQEFRDLKSHFVISSSASPGWGGRRSAPYSLYRTGRGYALIRAQQPARHRGEYRDRTRIRSA